MKKIFLAVIPALLLAVGCTQPQKVQVTVANSLDLNREGEVVELAWADVAAALKGVTADNVIVLNTDGVEIVSQAVYEGSSEPQKLIFEATVAPNSESVYTLTTGTRGEYPVKAFGRCVPERLDDYAWENNLVAYRVYGPALKDPVAPGIDVWAKSTEKMVIDEWYAKADYHHNYGDGLDAYKVATTLGGGASVPFVDGKLWLSANYAEQQNLDNGPLRTSVKLIYAPFMAGDKEVALEKTITLDANTRFSKMVNVYTGNFESIPIAAGMVMHNVKESAMTPYYVALTEELSDTSQPDVDGDISLAVIMPSAQFSTEADGHLVIVGDVVAGEPLVYWSGSGWSQGGVADHAAWISVVENELAKINSPLSVSINK